MEHPYRESTCSEVPLYWPREIISGPCPIFGGAVVLTTGNCRHQTITYFKKMYASGFYRLYFFFCASAVHCWNIMATKFQVPSARFRQTLQNYSSKLQESGNFSRITIKPTQVKSLKSFRKLRSQNPPSSPAFSSPPAFSSSPPIWMKLNQSLIWWAWWSLWTS